MPYVRLFDSKSFCQYITPMSVWLHARFLVFRELFLKQVKAYVLGSVRENEELTRLETQAEYETMYLDYAELVTGLIKALVDFGADTPSDFDSVLSQYLSEVEQEMVNNVYIPLDAAVRHLMRYETLLTYVLRNLVLLDQFPIKNELIVKQIKGSRTLVMYVMPPRYEGFRMYRP